MLTYFFSARTLWFDRNPRGIFSFECTPIRMCAHGPIRKKGPLKRKRTWALFWMITVFYFEISKIRVYRKLVNQKIGNLETRKLENWEGPYLPIIPRNNKNENINFWHFSPIFGQMETFPPKIWNNLPSTIN